MAYFRTGTNDFSSIQYTNLEAGNIKNGVTVTVKDPNDITLKSVTGTYEMKCDKIWAGQKDWNDSNPVNITLSKKYDMVVINGTYGSLQAGEYSYDSSFSISPTPTSVNSYSGGGYLSNNLHGHKSYVYKNLNSGTVITLRISNGGSMSVWGFYNE